MLSLIQTVNCSVCGEQFEYQSVAYDTLKSFLGGPVYSARCHVCYMIPYAEDTLYEYDGSNWVVVEAGTSFVAANITVNHPHPTGSPPDKIF